MATAAPPTRESQKVLGAFMTPPAIARWLVDWAVRCDSDCLLEPSVGDATFMVAAAERLLELGCAEPSSQVTGVEIDAEARQHALAVLHGWASPRLIHSDFFELSPEQFEPVDAVIGNPPYIRYHRFSGRTRALALEAGLAAGVRFSGLASSWAPFIVHASRFLNSRGRLALVLPAELLVVDYARPVRDFLLTAFGSVDVLTFEKAMFPGAMIDMVLLLADKTGDRGLRVHSFDSLDSISLDHGQAAKFPRPRWDVLRVHGEGPQILAALRRAGRLSALGDLASVDIGIVTGANDYFILPPKLVDELGMRREKFIPVLTRPSLCAGARLTGEDLRSWAGLNERHLLLTVEESDRMPGSPLDSYLRSGEASGIANRFKCRTRKPWYRAPRPGNPDAFLSYMSSGQPRIVRNLAGVGSTNLVHNVAVHPGVSADALVAALYSSPSLLSFELEGRSYGGGVLKTETKESERVLVPHLTPTLQKRLETALVDIDRALRDGSPSAATSLVDQVLLEEEVLDLEELRRIRETRDELRSRRERRGASQ